MMITYLVMLAVTHFAYIHCDGIIETLLGNERWLEEQEVSIAREAVV